LTKSFALAKPIPVVPPVQSIHRSIHFNQRRVRMTNQFHLIARFAQGLLAVSATVASIVVFQLA
jgi:hypothetical protein